MSLQFSTLAQLAPAPEVPEATPGNVIAGIMILAALTGSLSMIVVWINRVKRGTDIFPAAARKPLSVPLAVMICGILLTSLMALMAAGQVAETPADEKADAVAISESDETTEGAATASAEAKDVVSEVSESGSDTAESREDDGSRTIASDMSPDSEVSDSKAAAADDAITSTPAEATDDAEPMTEAKLIRMLYSTLTMNGMMFLFFGGAILLSQQLSSRAPDNDEGAGYESLQATALPHSRSRFPDLDEPPDVTALYESVMDEHAPPNPFLPVSPEATGGYERWNAATELRYACETFLVAYLPTALLRILILQLQPDAPSHPFLEVMQDGVSWTMLSLLALMAVVVAPIVEELLYRVTILGGLMQQRSLLAGWIVSSLLFGFAHGFPDSIALLPLAFALGYTYIRRRSYRTVVLVHFLFNAFNMLIAAIGMQ